MGRRARARQPKINVLNDGAPLWSEDGEWLQTKQFNLCCRACVCLCACTNIQAKVPWMRGIPSGSDPLSQADKDALCAKMAGHWHIQPLGCDTSAPESNQKMLAANTVVYTDMEVRGDSLYISGGMHNSTQQVGSNTNGNHSQSVTTAVANTTPKSRRSSHFAAQTAGFTLIISAASSLMNRTARWN